jgi:AraC-like DNA-binding protein
MRRIARDEWFRYLPVSERERRWGLYVVGAGRIVRAFPGDPDKGHPAPFYYVWDHGRVLSDWGVVYVAQGEGEFESEATGLLRVGAGTLMVVFPNMWHRYRPRRETGWTYYWAHFGGEYPQHLADERFITPESPVLRTGPCEVVLQAYLSMLDRMRSEPPGYQQLTAANIMEIFGGALAAVRQHPDQGTMADVARRAAALLDQRAEQLVNMSELADSFGMSYDRFRHVFKMHTGLGPYQYHLQRRINRAKELLACTSLSMREIATLLKFDDYYHFSRVFRQKTGVSPSQWRGVPDEKGRG